MKIMDRIKGIDGVESAYWDSRKSRLVIYYHETMALDTIKIKVVGAIDDAFLHNAIEDITLINLGALV